MPLELCRSNPRQLLIRNDRNEILGNTDPKPNEFHYKIYVYVSGGMGLDGSLLINMP